MQRDSTMPFFISQVLNVNSRWIVKSFLFLAKKSKKTVCRPLFFIDLSTILTLRGCRTRPQFEFTESKRKSMRREILPHESAAMLAVFIRKNRTLPRSLGKSIKSTHIVSDILNKSRVRIEKPPKSR